MTASEQLELAIESRTPSLGIPHRLRLMQPTLEHAPFDDPDYFFEPWWPGARVVVIVEDGRLRLQTEYLGEALDSFPELADLGRYLQGDGLALEGTLLVLDDAGRPDGELLRTRLGTPGSPGGHAAFVAADLLYADRRSWMVRPFVQRRQRLREAVRDGDWCVVSRGLVGEGLTLAEALREMGIGAMSARRLDARYVGGPARDAWFRLAIADTPRVETRPLLALIQRLPL